MEIQMLRSKKMEKMRAGALHRIGAWGALSDSCGDWSDRSAVWLMILEDLAVWQKNSNFAVAIAAL
ncbi:hypothetical protein EEL50_05400 [Muribaculaceae bacterium Isolate-105 (HZI)]|nr:hypothetical protein C5O24_06050 [Paramuribaculum intestinale]ROT15452.1 hypothetical protein EEL50_05400 [Muribaculaceae bacterium Isolate-105 (HZI)]